MAGACWRKQNAPLAGEHLQSINEFVVREGDTVPFVLTYGDYGAYREMSVGHPRDPEKAYKQTHDFWVGWAGKGTYSGLLQEMVDRSLITLKALTYLPTGGVVAAPISSLSEDLGGVRNWDYRYCWLRDTTFTLLALINGGCHEEARDWMRRLHRSVAGKPDQLQIMYGISGERTLAEWEMKGLSGYENSRPMRIGNAAAEQMQLDTYGEGIDAFFWTYSALDSKNKKTDSALLRALWST